jgi:hypothetical protein
MTVLEIAVVMVWAVGAFAAGWFLWATSSDRRCEVAVRQIRWLRSKLVRRSR